KACHCCTLECFDQQVGAAISGLSLSPIPSEPPVKSQPSDSHTDINTPVKLDLWRRIYSRLGQYWKGAILAVILTSVASATQPALAIIMKPLLDNGFTGEKPYYIWFIPLSFVLLVVTRGVMSYFSSYLYA